MLAHLVVNLVVNFCVNLVVNTLRKAEDLMPRDIISSEPRHWMLFGSILGPWSLLSVLGPWFLVLGAHMGRKEKCRGSNRAHMEVYGAQIGYK